MKKAILASSLALLFLSGCTKNTPERTQVAGVDFVVETLFTHEGCTVYKFRDLGTLRYYAKCTAAESTASWNESCGKGCYREMTLPASAPGH